jgi:hypothetical protein
VSTLALVLALWLGRAPAVAPALDPPRRGHVPRPVLLRPTSDPIHDWIYLRGAA